MKKILQMLMCGMAFCFVVACSNGGDEPEPNPNPDPDQPTDPYADVEEDWQGQKPFFFLTEATSFTISNLDEQGFLYNTRKNCSYWTQAKWEYNGAPQKTSEKNANKAFEVIINIDGHKASPFINRKDFETCCLDMGIRPATNAPLNLPALDSLPTYEVRSSHMTDCISNVEFRCPQVWFAEVTPGDNLVDPTTQTVWQKTEKPWIDWFKNPTNTKPDFYSCGSPYYPSVIKGYDKSVHHQLCRPEALVYLILADEPGIYDMTLTITFKSGNVCERSFKVRVEPEGYTEGEE